jgi:transposase-like protein
VPERQRWPKTVKEAAARLAQDDGLALSDVAERLRSDHGVDVPISTLSGWLARAHRTSIRSDIPRSMEGLAGRAVRLADEEMTALERHGRRPVDLERLGKLIALLRSIEALKAAAPKVKGRARQLAELGEGLGLEDLTDPLSEAQIEE